MGRDVGVDAGLDVSPGIHMGVLSAGGDAALYMRAVILEIDKEERLRLAEFFHLPAEVIPLLRGDQERNIALTVDRHVEEVHLDEGAQFQSFGQRML